MIEHCGTANDIYIFQLKGIILESSIYEMVSTRGLLTCITVYESARTQMKQRIDKDYVVQSSRLTCCQSFVFMAGENTNVTLLHEIIFHPTVVRH